MEEVGLCFYLDEGINGLDHLDRIIPQGKAENMPGFWVSLLPNRNKQQIKHILNPFFHLFNSVSKETHQLQIGCRPGFCP